MCVSFTCQYIIIEHFVVVLTANTSSKDKVGKSSPKSTIEDFMYDMDMDLRNSSGIIYDNATMEYEDRDDSDLICLADPLDRSYDMPMPPWGYPSQKYMSVKEIARESSLHKCSPSVDFVTRKAKPAFSKRVLSKVRLSMPNNNSPIKKNIKTPKIWPSLVPQCHTSMFLSLPLSRTIPCR